MEMKTSNMLTEQEKARLHEIRAYCSQFEKEIGELYDKAEKGTLKATFGSIANQFESNEALIDKALEICNTPAN